MIYRTYGSARPQASSCALTPSWAFAAPAAAVEAFCSDGRIVRLAESGCAAGFHVELLAELGRARADTRWLLVIAAETSRDGPRWTRSRVHDLAEPGNDGSPR